MREFNKLYFYNFHGTYLQIHFVKTKISEKTICEQCVLKNRHFKHILNAIFNQDFHHLNIRSFPYTSYVFILWLISSANGNVRSVRVYQKLNNKGSRMCSRNAFWKSATFSAHKMRWVSGTYASKTMETREGDGGWKDEAFPEGFLKQHAQALKYNLHALLCFKCNELNYAHLNLWLGRCTL